MRTKPITRFGVWVLLVVFGGVSLGETGCSTKTPKYPEDHDRFQRVVQAIKTLETAYVNKDTAAFHGLLLPLEQLEILEAKVQQDFSTFSTIQVDLTIDRLVINESRISAFISWQGAWQRSAQESPVESRGHGVLLWSGTQVILLRGVEGDLPFGITSRLNLPS
ncbi:MAG: hypothetical protein OEY91_04810 [Nitrospirota bacterium]|nr:hypothetical protein [Nitrospirota bacterium]